MNKLKKLCVILLMTSCFALVGCSVNITFDTGDNSQKPVVIRVDESKTSESITEQLDKLTKENYEVEGLYYDESYTHEWKPSDVINKSVTLFVKWIGKDYNFEFDANGGNGVMPLLKVKFDESINLPKNILTKNGYKFSGWSKSKDGDVVYKDEALARMDNAGVTLFAQWSPNNYHIIYDKNSAEEMQKSVEINFEQTVNIAECDFVLNGYTFAGWNTKKDGTGTSYADGAEFTLTQTNDVTLFAQWSVNEYDIVFNKNSISATGQMDNQKVKYDVRADLKECGFVLNGYTFDGWNTKENGTGEEYLQEGKFLAKDVFDAIFDNKINLYAQWKPNTYCVVFNSNTGLGTMTQQEIDYNDKANLNSCGFTKKGHTFAGWNTKKDGTGTPYANSAEFTMSSEGVTLFAQWNANTYSISFNANGGTGNMANFTIIFGESKLLPENLFEREGYIFACWNTEENGTGVNYSDKSSFTMKCDNNVNLFAQWNAVGYYVSFNANGGKGTMIQQEIDYNDKANLNSCGFTKTGYTFVGWNTKEDGTGTSYADGAEFTMSSEGVTLFAQWNANTYSISFKSNGGTGNMDDLTIIFGESKPLPENSFERKGYIFACWNTEENGTGATYDNGAEFTMNSEGATLFAQWNKEKYNFTFKNGSATVQILSVEYDSVIKNNRGFDAKKFSFVNNPPIGEKFDGFYLENDTEFTNKILLTSTVGDFGENGVNITLNTRFIQLRRNVNFHYGEGVTSEFDKESVEVGYGDEIGALPEPLKNGFSFVGWYTSKDIWTDETLVTATTVWKNNFNDLYAKFVDNSTEFNFSLNLDGGTVDNQSNIPTSFKITDLPLIIGGATWFEPGGKLFKGYELVEDAYIGGVLKTAGTLLEVTTIPKNSFGNISLIATWEVQTHSITYKKYVNGVDGDSKDVLTVSGNYGSEVVLTDEQSVAISTGMSMYDGGLIFVGWFDEDNLTDPLSIFPSQNKVLYARYVRKLTTPKNVSMEQNSTVLTWDKVEGAEKYEIIIDNGTPLYVTDNSYDSDLQLAMKGKYEVKVRAISSIKGVLNQNGTDVKESIDSDFTTFSFVRQKDLNQSGLIRIEGEGDRPRYVMFTGNTYTFDSSNYVLKISEQSVEGLVNLNVTTNSDTSVHSSCLEIAGDKVGNFVFVVDYDDDATVDKSYQATVVQDVMSLSYGASYTSYLTAVESSNTPFLNPVKTPYTIGTGSPFAFDFELTKEGVSYSNIDYTNEELLTYDFKVKDGEIWRNATETELPERLNADDENGVKKGMLKFADENAGKTYKVTVSWKYSKNTSQDNPFGTLTCEFEFLLNKGYNALTHEQLKTFFGDDEIHIVNVLRNITPVLSADQTQEDGSPINVSSGIENGKGTFDSDNTLAVHTNSDDPTVYKTDGNIYKRVYNSLENDEITVNGNYMTIDASRLPLVNPNYSKHNVNDETYIRSSLNVGINGQIGLNNNENFVLVRGHIAVFKYQIWKGEGGHSIFNNLKILGNRPTTPINKGNLSDEEYKELLDKRITDDSCCYCAFNSEGSRITLNNNVVYNLNSLMRNDNVFKNYDTNSPNKQQNNAITICNYVRCEGTSGSAIYSWEGKAVGIYNSYFTALNGAVAQIRNEGTVTAPIFAMDEATVVDNYLTGNESWFIIWGLTELTTQLKGNLQPALYQMGASANVKIGEGDINANNLIFVYEPVDSGTGGGYIDGGVWVEHEGRASYCTVYMGGEKELIDDKFPATTGVKSEHKYDKFSGDPRVVNDMYTFAITDFEESESFGVLAGALGDVMGSAELQKLMIMHSFNKVGVWDIAKGKVVKDERTVEKIFKNEANFGKFADNFLRYMIVNDTMYIQQKNNHVLSGYVNYVENKQFTDATGIYNQIMSGITTGIVNGSLSGGLSEETFAGLVANYLDAYGKSQFKTATDIYNGLISSIRDVVVSIGGDESITTDLLTTTLNEEQFRTACNNYKNKVDNSDTNGAKGVYNNFVLLLSSAIATKEIAPGLILNELLCQFYTEEEFKINAFACVKTDDDTELLCKTAVVEYASSKGANPQTMLGQFMLLKMAVTINENSQAFKVCHKIGSAGAYQVIIIEFGFKDQHGWASGS